MSSRILNIIRFLMSRSSWFYHVILLLAISKFLYRLEHSIDIQLWDETWRLKGGLASPNLFGEFSLYELWYSFLALFYSKPTQLYFLNYGVLVALSVLCIYIYIGQKKGYNLFSLWLSLLFLLSMSVYKAWPFTHYFGLKILLERIQCL